MTSSSHVVSDWPLDRFVYHNHTNTNKRNASSCAKKRIHLSVYVCFKNETDNLVMQVSTSGTHNVLREATRKHFFSICVAR